MTLDPQAYIKERLRNAARPDLSPEELRYRILSALGGLQHWERPALDARITETRQLNGYRRETVLFTSRPGLTVFGYFLTPDGMAEGERRPAVLCLPGHGAGVDTDIGLTEDGRQLAVGESDDYAGLFPLQCVAHGYPVLAIEQIGFGHRRRNSPEMRVPRDSSCHPDSMAALMLGESMIGWRVWDAIRALDYLETRSEVDPTKLVTMGISGGGLTSLFTGALDTRVAACVVSGYLNTFADSVLSVHHCADNYAPGLSALCEMPDIAALIAPRALVVESGERDHIFPIAAFQGAVQAMEATYAQAGVPERFAWSTFDDGHRWDGTGVWPFLERIFATA